MFKIFTKDALRYYIFSPDTRTKVARDSFTVPESYAVLGDNAFQNIMLKKITLPKSLKIIGASAFFNCTCLEEIVIPEEVDHIPWDCFNGCKSLKKVTFLGTPKFIGAAAFRNCSALKEIVIPNETFYVDSQETDGSFSGCTDIKISGGFTANKLSKNSEAQLSIEEYLCFPRKGEAPDNILEELLDIFQFETYQATGGDEFWQNFLIPERKTKRKKNIKNTRQKLFRNMNPEHKKVLVDWVIENGNWAISEPLNIEDRFTQSFEKVVSSSICVGTESAIDFRVSFKVCS